jgi:Spy/CpxP family protein refolding chaperone
LKDCTDRLHGSNRYQTNRFEKEIFPMLKHSLLALVAASLISFSMFAAAQDSQTNDQMAQEHGHRRGGPDPAERTAELTKHLKLTSDQQAKVKDALESEHSQMGTLHQDSSLSREDRRAKMMDIRKNTDAQIRSLLDATQQKKFDEMQARREQWHHQGSPEGGSEQGPPQK